MILGGGKPLKGLKQEVAGTLWLDHSRGRCLLILVELMLLPERQGRVGMTRGSFSVVPFGPKYGIVG